LQPAKAKTETVKEVWKVGSAKKAYGLFLVWWE